MEKGITQSVKKINYWKYATLCLLLILFLSILFFSLTGREKKLADKNLITQATIAPTLTPVLQNITYPSGAFWLTEGTAAIKSADTFEDKFFTLSLQSYANGETPVPEKIYRIPLENIDYVSDPKISYDSIYGCVTVGASGYSGYYVFTLSDGKKVDQGEQYSHCVEWISSHQVIIAENLYNTREVKYYILDGKDKSKKVLSIFDL